MFILRKFANLIFMCYSFVSFRGDNNMSKRKKIFYTSILALIMSVTPFGKAHKIAEPLPSSRVTKVGKASWYSHRSPGINITTANNEIFDDTAMTCAMWGVKFNQKIKVTNLDNGKSVIVRVNDRGPHRRYVNAGRIIDLTQAAFERLSPSSKGLINVQIELL